VRLGAQRFEDFGGVARVVKDQGGGAVLADDLGQRIDASGQRLFGEEPIVGDHGHARQQERNTGGEHDDQRHLALDRDVAEARNAHS